MDVFSNEKYLISKAKSALVKDPYAAKAWIIAAKTLFPNDFGIQFEAYLLEKSEDNYKEAANCFSYIVMTFQNQPVELWNEISQLTAALRLPEGGTTADQEFYFRMFQHISYEVQHKILLLTANHSENTLDHCRLILLLLKRFPQAIATHTPRLLETLVQGVATSPQYREMLVQEALPLIFHKPPELSSHLVNRIIAITLEYYINQMFKDVDDKNIAVMDCWKKIFDVIEVCGKLLKWESFLPFNKSWSKDVYWQKLIQIVSSAPPRPSENKQILFCASIIFVFSLQEYMENVRHKIQNTDVEFTLLEAFKDPSPGLSTKRRKSDAVPIDATQITVNWPCNKETPICLITAANCWQLLHSNEILQMDFNGLLINLPLSSWINRFLLDLAIYLGRNEEIHSILKTQMDSSNGLEKNLRLLSLALSQGNLNVQVFDYITSILNELPVVSGDYISNFSIMSNGRHLILLPMTRKAIVQYCTKVICSVLKQKVFTDPNCSNMVLGNLLVLLQLDWPQEIVVAEKIFDIIRQRRSFSYVQFPAYIINIDIIEEFMYLWYPHGGEIQLEFTVPQNNIGSRRIGTRGADKGVKEDFKQIIKQQILRSNDEIDVLVAQFITQERAQLIQSVFDK